MTVAAAELQPAQPAEAGGEDQRFGLGHPPRASLRQDVTFLSLKLDKLRFYLDGESGLVNILYELLFSRLNRIQIRDLTPGFEARPDHAARLGAERGGLWSE